MIISHYYNPLPMIATSLIYFMGFSKWGIRKKNIGLDTKIV